MLRCAEVVWTAIDVPISTAPSCSQSAVHGCTARCVHITESLFEAAKLALMSRDRGLAPPRRRNVVWVRRVCYESSGQAVALPAVCEQSSRMLREFGADIFLRVKFKCQRMQTEVLQIRNPASPPAPPPFVCDVALSSLLPSCGGPLSPPLPPSLWFPLSNRGFCCDGAATVQQAVCWGLGATGFPCRHWAARLFTDVVLWPCWLP